MTCNCDTVTSVAAAGKMHCSDSGLVNYVNCLEPKEIHSSLSLSWCTCTISCIVLIHVHVSYWVMLIDSSSLSVTVVYVCTCSYITCIATDSCSLFLSSSVRLTSNFDNFIVSCHHWLSLDWRLVTGATGQVGSQLVRELVAAGHHVTGLTRSQAGADKLKQWGATPLMEISTNDDSLVDGVKDADAAVHLEFNHDFSQYEQAIEPLDIHQTAMPVYGQKWQKILWFVSRSMDVVTTSTQLLREETNLE